MKESRVIQVIQSQKNVTVKAIVQQLREELTRDDRNRDLLRQILKRVSNHSKDTGIVTLKPEFQS